MDFSLTKPLVEYWSEPMICPKKKHFWAAKYRIFTQPVIRIILDARSLKKHVKLYLFFIFFDFSFHKCRFAKWSLQCTNLKVCRNTYTFVGHFANFEWLRDCDFLTLTLNSFTPNLLFLTLNS